MATSLLLVCVHLAEAQQPNNIPRIGFLHPASAASVAARRQAFQKGLREAGYAESKNITVEYRYGDGELERVKFAAAELVESKIDVLVMGAGSATSLQRRPPGESDRYGSR